MSTAKVEVLRRIEAALGPARSPGAGVPAESAATAEPPGLEVPADAAAPVELPRHYRRAGSLADEQRAELFCERAADYQARVHRVGADEVEGALTGRCTELGVRSVTIPPELPWRPSGVKLERDEPALAPARLDRSEGVLTGCAAAIAETGTVVLDSSPRCGRRALTLVPDLHLCVVEATAIVETVPEAIEALAPTAFAGAPLTFVSGPSATSDIELKRVDGVHGPRRLELFVVWY